MTEVSPERALGRVEGKIDNLIKSQENAEASRRRTHEQLDYLTRQQEATKRDIEDMKDRQEAAQAALNARLESVEEPVAEFSKWRERLIGAIGLVGLLSAAVGSAAAWVWTKVIAFLQG